MIVTCNDVYRIAYAQTLKVQNQNQIIACLFTNVSPRAIHRFNRAASKPVISLPVCAHRDCVASNCRYGYALREISTVDAATFAVRFKVALQLPLGPQPQAILLSQRWIASENR